MACDFDNLSKLNGKVPFPITGSGIVSVTIMRFGSTGRIFSSPSLKFPAEAMILYCNRDADASAGTDIFHVTVVDEPLERASVVVRW